MTMSLKEYLASVPTDQAEDHLARCSEAELLDMAKGAWWYTSRPEQIAPEGDWGLWLILAGRGFGKAVPICTELPVPEGWKKMGDIQVGDQVFDEAGKPCTVLATFDRTPAKAYRLHFSDGTYVDACNEHEWVTWTHAERKAYLRSRHEPDTSRFPENWATWKARRLPTNVLGREVIERALELGRAGMSARRIAKNLNVSRNALTPHLKAGRYVEPAPVVRNGALGPQTRTTQEIINTFTYGSRGDTNHCIPVAGALQLPDRELPIDPYLLGIWLGDGSAAAAVVTTMDEEIVDAFRAAGHRISWYGEITFGLPGGFLGLLRKSGVLGNKHVPAAYLRASAAQRLALLQGLMDSDGHAHVESGCVEFCNTNKNLVDAVVELARSLGQKPVVAESRATLNGVDCGAKWRVTWRPTIDVFRLPRKLANQARGGGSQGLRNHHRMIVGYEEIDPIPMRCITVDSLNEMFLVGEAMIPTHNSRCVYEWLVQRVIDYPLDVAGEPTSHMVVAPSIADCENVSIEGESGILPILRREGIEYHYVKSPRPKIIIKEHGTKIFFVGADKADAGRGYNLASLVLDELVKFPTPRDLWFQALLPALRANIPGDRPRAACATTPKPIVILKEWVKESKGLLPAEEQEKSIGIKVTRGSTFDNAANLNELALNGFRRAYAGTSMGRQELEGVLLDALDGPLFSYGDIDDNRVSAKPEIVEHITVGVDPNLTGAEDADLMGVVVVARGKDEHMYVLADESKPFTGEQAARHVWLTLAKYGADSVVVEDNLGKAWLKKVLLDTFDQMVREGVFPQYTTAPLKTVHSNQGKKLRAEPVSLRYEQGRVHHVGVFEKLEEEQVGWDPVAAKDSPDRLDALVHACRHLMEGEKYQVRMISPVRRRIPGLAVR